MLRRRNLPSLIAFSRVRAHSTGPRRLNVTESSGLYGFDELKTAKGFRRFVDDGIERSKELISYIFQKPPAMEVIRAIDQISNTVCRIVDSAELCRHTHPDREFVVEATNASTKISEYLHDLNTNKSLYDAIRNAQKENLLTNEAERAAASFRMDFEKGGIHLSAGKMDEVNNLSMRILFLGREFNENIIADPGYIDVFPASRLPKHLQNLGRSVYRDVPQRSNMASKSGNTIKEKCLRVKTDPDTLNSILRWTTDSEVRKLAYITGNSVPCANLSVLDQLISARHELAQMMGCKSYAEFALSPNLAVSPDVVCHFLQSLSDIVRPKANEEFETIRNFKKQQSGGSFRSLEPWDESYFTGTMKCSAYNVDPSVVASYFTLSHCIEGLKILVESLFGVRFETLPLAQGESWHPSVTKMSVVHPEEGDVGYLYLDLYTRKGKHPGCAHFSIQGGCRLSQTEYQLPAVALVCNFSSPSGLVNPMLNHWEVEVLFHEFGHALHSLLSRTDYQHFSGTRVVLDLAEVPSNLFEYYAWDYRVLKRFSKHYSTGEVIPEKLVNALKDARNMFAATELQRQIYYSLMDQELFGEEASSARDTVSLVGELKRKYTSWSHVEGTHWHTRFSHFVNYGAGYYSYLYARCFAATIWDQVCREDPLSPVTGSAIRNFLQSGGAEDPKLLLKEFAGDGILRCYNGGVIPDVSSLCKELQL